MATTDWSQQTDKPLFDDLLWARPEKRSLQGKIAIVGGTTHDLFGPLAASQSVARAKAGELRVLLPETAPTALWQNPGVEKLPVTQGGGISLGSRAMVMASADWADVVLLPGSLGKASESTQLISDLLSDHKVNLVACGDSVDAILLNHEVAIGRESTLLILTLSQMQHLAKAVGSLIAPTYQLPLRPFIDLISELSLTSGLNLAVSYSGQLIAACGQRVSSTKIVKEYASETALFVDAASYGAVLWAQFPMNLFKAATTAIWLISAKV